MTSPELVRVLVEALDAMHSDLVNEAEQLGMRLMDGSLYGLERAVTQGWIDVAIKRAYRLHAALALVPQDQGVSDEGVGL